MKVKIGDLVSFEGNVWDDQEGWTRKEREAIVYHVGDDYNYVFLQNENGGLSTDTVARDNTKIVKHGVAAHVGEVGCNTVLVHNGRLMSQEAGILSKRETTKLFKNLAKALGYEVQG